MGYLKPCLPGCPISLEQCLSPRDSLKAAENQRAAQQLVANFFKLAELVGLD